MLCVIPRYASERRLLLCFAADTTTLYVHLYNTHLSLLPPVLTLPSRAAWSYQDLFMDLLLALGSRMSTLESSPTILAAAAYLPTGELTLLDTHGAMVVLRPAAAGSFAVHTLCVVQRAPQSQCQAVVCQTLVCVATDDDVALFSAITGQLVLTGAAPIARAQVRCAWPCWNGCDVRTVLYLFLSCSLSVYSLLGHALFICAPSLILCFATSAVSRLQQQGSRGVAACRLRGLGAARRIRGGARAGHRQPDAGQ